MNGVRKFKCKNRLGLLFGTFAELFYSEEDKKYYVVIGDIHMGYDNKLEALKDLAEAEFIEIKEGNND